MVFQGPIVAVLAVYWLRRSAGHCFFSNYDVTCTGRHIPPVVFFFFPFCFDIPQHSLSLDLNVFLSAPTDLLRLLLSVVFLICCLPPNPFDPVPVTVSDF